MKETKGNLERGITLVALIITIIVMLILVGVTVSVVVDSDIIGQAEQAGDAYKDSYNEELKGNITIGDTQYNSLSEYIKTICNHTNLDADLKCTNCGVQLISFTIEGTEYKAESGMTWEEYIRSEYNRNGRFTIEVIENGTIDGVRIDRH